MLRSLLRDLTCGAGSVGTENRYVSGTPPLKCPMRTRLNDGATPHGVRCQGRVSDVSGRAQDAFH